MVDRICSNCSSNITYTNKQGWKEWHKHKDGWLCKKCYMKLVNNPKWQKIHSKIYSPLRITFKGKRIRLKKNPRNGKCVNCENSIGDEFIDRFGNNNLTKQTHMHHEEYHDEDPLKDAKELCNSCHSKITVMNQIRRKDAYYRRGK